MPTEVFNPHGAMEAVRPSVVLWSRTDSGGFGWTDQQRKASWRYWSEVEKAHPHVAAWATIGAKGHAPWFPADHVPAVEQLVWRNDVFGKPGSRLKCRVGRPCEAITHGDAWHSNLCGRPAKQPVEMYREMGQAVPGCPLHLAAQKRSDDNMAAHRARWQAKDEARDRAKNNNRASDEWAARLREELGIRAEASAHTGREGEALRVLVEPERLYRQLTELLVELKGLGLDEEVWPFHPGDVTGR